MTMDRNGVNEFMDDDYSNSTCDCKWCARMRDVVITDQYEDDISFDLVDNEGIMKDIEEELQAAEFNELLASDVESSMVGVLYSFETGEKPHITMAKIDALRDLLSVMEMVVINES